MTFCTKWRIDYFGEIIDGKILLNDYWKIIQEWIIKTQNIRKEIEFDEYIIMPNHIHIIIIVKNMENQNFVGNAGMRSDSMIRSKLMMHPKKNVGPHVCWPYKNSIMNKTKNHVSNAIQWLKVFITKEIRQNHGDYEFTWQKSFHDVIIRNQEQLDKTREYIILNPSKWKEDINNFINFWNN